MLRFNDSPTMPGTGESAEERLARALPLFGTPGEAYVEKRGIPVQVAHDASVRFEPDWHGRPAVLVPMKDAAGNLCSLHGRYLQHIGEQNKMLTIGPGGGVVTVMEGLRRDSIILVEGLFDALTLGLCGYGSVATVGRWAPWLPEVCAGKVVWLAFDGNHPGEGAALRYKQLLVRADTRRLPPPGRSKDWNTALANRGRATVEAWLRRHLGEPYPIDT